MLGKPIQQLRVLISDLSFEEPGNIIILPYVDACLRSYCLGLPELNERVHWMEPITCLNDLDAPLPACNVFGISLYCWNEKAQLALAARMKNEHPDTLIVAGGPQVPNDCWDYLESKPFIDMVVHGEGERAFAAILHSRITNQPLAAKLPVSVRSSTKKSSDIKFPSDRLDLKNLPSPFLNGKLELFVAEAKKRGKFIMAIWETSRGCPYSCTFCDWGSATASRIRPVENQRLLAEADWFGQQKIGLVFCVDANFGILPRDLDTAKNIVEVNEKYGHPWIFFATYAKNNVDRTFEIIKVLETRGLGFGGATVSVQSLHEPTLKAIRRENIGFKKYLELSDRALASGLPVASELVLGLPLETKPSFVNGIKRLLEAHIQNIRIHPLQILPNAEMNQPEYKKKYQLKTVVRQVVPTSTSIETMEVVVATSSMPSEDWIWCAAFSYWVQAMCTANGIYTIFQYLSMRQMDAFDLLLLRPFENFHLSRFQILKSIALEIATRITNDDRSTGSGVHFYSDETGRLRGQVIAMPFARIWLEMMKREEEFYADVVTVLKTETDLPDDLIVDLVQFQRFLLIRPSFSPQNPPRARFSYDWIEILKGGASLPKSVEYSIDQATSYLNIPFGDFPTDSLPLYYRHTLSPTTPKEGMGAFLLSGLRKVEDQPAAQV